MRSFKPEIAEIIVQLTSEHSLSGYKVSDLSRWRKIRHSVLRSLRELLSRSRNASPGPDISGVQLLFVIDTNNHLKQYRALRKHLADAKVAHTVLFLNSAVYTKRWVEVVGSIPVDAFYRHSDNVRAFFRLWAVNSSLLFRNGFREMTHTGRWSLVAELFYLNCRLLMDKYRLESAVSRIIGKSLKTVVFYKAEGYRVRSLIELCNGRGMHTLSIQHGLITRDIKYNQLQPKEYLVWSELFGKELHRSGAGCKTVVIGCPDYDRHFQQNRTGVEHNGCKIKLLFLPNSGKSQTPESEVVFALKACLQCINTLTDCELSLKAHPGGDTELLNTVVKEFGGKPVTLLEKDAQLDFSAYDIAVTMNSTIGIEAAIYRVPLIILLSSPEMLMVQDYLTYGIGEFVTGGEAMVSAVKKILCDRAAYQHNCDTFVADYLTNPGNAGAAIADHISRTVGVHA